MIRSGQNSADLALLEVLSEGVTDRFAEVVIVSGDGIFADAAASLAQAGVLVTVLASRDRLSRRLRLAAGAVTELPQPIPDAAGNPRLSILQRQLGAETNSTLESCRSAGTRAKVIA